MLDAEEVRGSNPLAPTRKPLSQVGVSRLRCVPHPALDHSQWALEVLSYGVDRLGEIPSHQCSQHLLVVAAKVLRLGTPAHREPTVSLRVVPDRSDHVKQPRRTGLLVHEEVEPPMRLVALLGPTRAP